MVKIVKGDLLQATENVIAHQVNCQGVMGSGVAVQVKHHYPLAFTNYSKLCSEYQHYSRLQDLLGRAQLVYYDHKIIANLFGQFTYGADGERYTSYDALYNAFVQLNETIDVDHTIAMPYKIGCDRGGADWDIVFKMIEKVFVNRNVTLYRKGE